MAKKFWSDWADIGDALMIGRKFVWSLIFAVVFIVMFFPIMA